MTCATCGVRVERVLSRQEGVENAAVNLAGATASVQTDSFRPFYGREPVETTGV